MTRRLSWAGLVLAVLVLAGPAPARDAGGGATGPVAARALRARLAAAGRAEASLTMTTPDPLGGKPRTARGRLALELPRCSRLDFAGGESLTLRADGGEWLQPRAHQLVRSGPRGVAPALRWSAILLATASDSLRERATGGGLFELTPVGADSSERTRVWLDARGLPARIELGEGEERRTIRLAAWRFTAPRGPAAFVLKAPPGVEVVDLP